MATRTRALYEAIRIARWLLTDTGRELRRWRHSPKAAIQAPMRSSFSEVAPHRN